MHGSCNTLAIEAGGTKFLAALGDCHTGQIFERFRLATGDDPQTVVKAIVEWSRNHCTASDVKAIGIGSFGPVDVKTGSPTFGHILKTPKPGWAQFPLAPSFARAFPEAVLGFDTDVNAALLGEMVQGAARDVQNVVYITIGTGIGGGATVNGQLLHGATHPEMGHLRLKRLPGDTFAGNCPYHCDCWEGLCSGPAIAKRTGIAAHELPVDHPAWPIIATYTAQAIASIICILSPERIILGGSVRKGGPRGEAWFFQTVQSKVLEVLNDYLSSPLLTAEQIQQFIIPPTLGDDSGIIGALMLGRFALQNTRG